MVRDEPLPEPDLIAALTRSLAHRGPDGEGQYFDGPVALAHTRLAIIDLVTGDQPFLDDQGVSLVANGEIYNYLELRDSLKVDGALFKTMSDCEVPLHLYRRHGVGFASHLRGMYAIAIHDPNEDVLILARDPFGIKPLYYAETETAFSFASEMGALLAADVADPVIRNQSRVELMQLQFCTGRNTVVNDIKRVLPGETLVVRGGRIVERFRQQSLPQGGQRISDEDAAMKQLDEALMESVALHQRSDVPYGLFLSGGIDSSVLLACMAQLNETPVRAFTAGFPRTDVHDERAHARMLAKRVGADHVEVEITEQDFWQLLPEIAAAMDDPVADYAIIPTYKLAREAAREMKVVLCGEGGDELFGGYGRYRSALRPWWQGGRAMRTKGIMDGFDVLREEPRGWRDGILAAESRSGITGRTRLQVAQAVDNADWLPNDLLVKLDRCLMAHGLEGRTPFLDPAVSSLAFCLDDDLKIRKGKGKYLLRKWLDVKLPEAEAFSPKRGFTVPVGEWIAAQGDKLAPLLAAQPGIIQICHPDAVARLVRRRGKRVGNAAWTLLFYALWHRYHVLRLPPQGDVFECLSVTA